MSGRLVVALGAACALLAAGCGDAGTRGGEAASGRAAAACARATALRITARVRVGRGAGPLTLADGRLWAARPAAGVIVPVGVGARPRAGRPVRVGGAPVSVAAAFGAVWVADRDGGRILRVGPASRTVSRWAEVDAPVKVAVAGARLFVISLDDGALYAIDPRTRGKGVDIGIPARGPVDAVQQGGELWVLGAADSDLTPLDVRTSTFRGAGVKLPVRVVGAVAAGQGAVWAALPTAQSVARLQPPSSLGTVRATRGFHPTAVAVDACTVWLGDPDGRVTRVDARSGRRVGRPLRIGRALSALVVDGDGVWASDPREGTVVRVAGRR